MNDCVRQMAGDSIRSLIAGWMGVGCQFESAWSLPMRGNGFCMVASSEFSLMPTASDALRT